MNDNQKMIMAYGVMKLALKEISNMTNNQFDGGNQLCDAIKVANKALDFLKENEI